MDEHADFTPTSTPFDRSKYRSAYEARRIDEIRSLIPLGRGKAAVDLGCGCGLFTQELQERGWSVLAVDTDPGNIEQASAFAASCKVGDALSVLEGIPAASFDLAVALEILEHMPRGVGETLVEELHRVIRPGGRLLLSTPNRASIEGLAGYYWGEKLRGWGRWNAWDETHVYIYSAPELLGLLTSKAFIIEEVVGYYFKGHLPLIGRRGLPLTVAKRFPLNRLGFNTITLSRKD